MANGGRVRFSLPISGPQNLQVKMARYRPTEDQDAQKKPASEVEKDPLLVSVGDRIDLFAIKPKRLNTEERRHKRLRATFKACIRYGDEEEIVDVQDFSRGGLRFSSFKLYKVGTTVNLSAPHTVGGNNIFTPAQVIRANRRPSGVVPGEYSLKLQS
jgi:hypothetical protein